MSRSGYWALPETGGNADDATDIPPVFVETGQRAGKGQWSQISDLDDFFTRVYKYHQRHGFMAIFFEDTLKLMQYMFVVVFSLFLAQCVKYDVMFREVEDQFRNHTPYDYPYIKVSIADTVVPVGQCIAGTSPALIVSVTIALFFWLFWFVKIMHSAVKNLEVRRFFHNVLNFADSDLPDLTWNKDILPRIILVQQEVELCVHKSTLTELDICQRILRFNNYMAAMVYRSPEPLLPLRLNIPCIGSCFYVSTGLRTCLEMVLFWRGPWSPFDTNWHLRDDYRRAENRERLASRLRRRAAFLGALNLLFLPVIFVWQLMYGFLSYTQLIRKDPTWLGARRWSTYGRLYGRLFNELDHQLEGRLSRAYEHARLYMASFPPHPLVVIMCRGLVFFASSILAVLLVLTLIDNDVLRVEGMLALMTSLGIIATLSSSILPDENMVYAPDLLLAEVQRHYRHLPGKWLEEAHSRFIRDEFAALFQYKAVWLMEELVSPFVTAYVLLFKFRSTSLPIVDFFRNFTIDVVGVGDVCSFALMNVDAQSTQTTLTSPRTKPVEPSAPKHGAAAGGLGYGATKPGTQSQAPAFGLQQAPPEAKAQMSLAQFALANPTWRPEGSQLQKSVVLKVRNDAAMAVSQMQQQQAQQLSSMMVPGVVITTLGGEPSYRPALEPSLAFFHSTTTSGGGGQAQSQKLRGPGLSRLDDYPSLFAPVMDRRQMVVGSPDSSQLDTLQGRKSGRLMTTSENAVELEELGHPTSQPLSTSGPPAIEQVVQVVDDEEIDPFASLIPLGVPLWTPPTDTIAFSGTDLAPLLPTTTTTTTKKDSSKP